MTQGGGESPGELPGRLVFVVFCPFAAGFFLSFLFRNVNAVISKDLASVFALSAADLGFVTGAYFLAFAAMQIPVGLFLDRYGPRLVVSSLLLVAAAGSTIFSIADGLATLTVGRALIGVGVSACLMGAMKAFTLWFPLERMATLNGVVIAVGGLGALAATTPLEAGVAAWGWRAMFATLAVLCMVCSAYILLVVPEKRLPGADEGWGEALRRMGVILSTPLFWRVSLPLTTVHATFQALLALWFVPWLIDVAGLDRPGAASWLFAAALSYTIASLVFGIAADQLAARGVSRLSLFKWGTGVAVACLFALAWAPAHGKFAILVVYAFAVLAPVISYVLLTRHFSPEVSGRVTTSMNIVMFLSTFTTQWSVGAVLRQFPAEGGRYAPEGYALAFGGLACIHLLVWLWLATLKREPSVYGK